MRDDGAFVCDAELRLVKLQCAALPADKHVAVVGCASDGISIGRDRVYTPRVRIPAMEISKHHAYIFCDLSTATAPDVQPRFFVADAGSTHGTYVYHRGAECLPLRAGELARVPDGAYVRLSAPRHASAPHALAHLDVLRFGTCAFEVHLHWPPRECDVCVAAPSEAISLETGRQHMLAEQPAQVFARSAAERRRMVDAERRARLRVLRPAGGSTGARGYKDRAKWRRGAGGGAQPAQPAPPAAGAAQPAPTPAAPSRAGLGSVRLK